MTELALVSRPRACPPRLQRRPADHPSRRPAEGHGTRDLRGRPTPRRPALCRDGDGDDRARSRRRARRRGGEGASRRRRGDDARKSPVDLRRPRPARSTFQLQVRGPAERSRPLCRPANRGRDRRDAGSGDGRRARCSRRATRPRKPRTDLGRRGQLQAACSSGRASRPRRKRATSKPASPTRRGQSTQTYETAFQFHNAMEPHAIVAAFEGDRLVIDMPTQALAFGRFRFAQIFGLTPDKVLVRCPFLGGGFGGKGLMSGPIVLGALAAKLTGKPVKLVATRAQLYGPFGHRSPTRQRVRLGADAEGRLTALSHHAKVASSSFEDFYEPSANISHTLYASPAIRTTRTRRCGSTRARRCLCARQAKRPARSRSKAPSTKWRCACGMDPLAVPPAQLRRDGADLWQAVLLEGAARMFCRGRGQAFGWQGRPLQPRQMRDADGLLVGWGVGVSTFPAVMFQGAARAVLKADGLGPCRDDRA